MFTYDFLGYDDLLIIAGVALFFIVRNWWDLIRYGIQRSLPPAATAITATMPVAFVRARRRAAPHAVRPGHRPVKPHQA